jgi:uncharacterized protein (DUF934 family)
MPIIKSFSKNSTLEIDVLPIDRQSFLESPLPLSCGLALHIDDFWENSDQKIKKIDETWIQKIVLYPLLSLKFQKFQDGRFYSIAHLLKQQYHYAGELRATGPLHADQAHFLYEAGFDSIELEDENTWVVFEKMMNIVRNRYQYHQLGQRQDRSTKID